MSKPNLKKVLNAKVEKIDNLGVVFGWGIICKENGEPYFDTQDDYIPEDAMMAAALDFMKNSREAHTMHTGEKVGPVVFCWPHTSDLSKAFGMKAENDRTGMLIGIQPNPDILEKFKSGEFRGFSIGGVRIQDETVDEDWTDAG